MIGHRMRSRLLTLVAVVVVAFLLATNPAVGQAAGMITGKQIKDGSVTGKDIKDGSLTSKDVSGLVAGPSGPAGPAGPQGPQGASATALWGVIKANTTVTSVQRSSGVTAATKLGNGTYRVDFNRSIAGCAYLATAGNTGSGGAPVRFVTVEQLSTDSPNSVQVRTFDAAGTQNDAIDDDDGFHIAVFC